MNPLVEILLISLFCLGWFTISDTGMVLEPFKLWVDKTLPVKGFLRALYMPIFGCPVCYASFWGTTLHFTMDGSLKMWLPVIVSVAFMNSMLLDIKHKLEN